MSPRNRPSPGDRVHQRVAVLRVERGLTRQQLAHALQVHPQTIGYIERGEFAPSLGVALRIARLYQLPVESVFSLAPFSPRTADELPGADHARH
ncbi:helix-turn-helix transcriptional regulator [Streptomyces sp. NPDC002262]|uniref:helix-turn-helix transcriptional regulator n=1 Tax=Streptomyces sp. NPDC002262 TaxID=3154414 RepID=UPI0033166DD2